VNLRTKTEVMVEHFRTHVKHKIGGRAKAMVVTEGRLHAVRYKLAFDSYIAEKGYTDVKTLVAFSGIVEDPDAPGKSFTEVGMNGGIKESELPERFDSHEYQVLLVAEKYQTGYDQPLLHTMYVDKKLTGLQAVQTLSRLNRTCAGKEDTFILDFRNTPEEIFKAFKPYYEDTPTEPLTDAQHLYRLQLLAAAREGAILAGRRGPRRHCWVAVDWTPAGRNWFQRKRGSLTGGRHTAAPDGGKEQA